MWFSIVCTLIDNDIGHHSAQKCFISERDQNHVTKKEQALSITFLHYDWFIFQNDHSWLAIALYYKLMRAWREQRCLHSYWQRQISQSDCEMTSNCGKKKFEPQHIQYRFPINLNQNKQFLSYCLFILVIYIIFFQGLPGPPGPKGGQGEPGADGPDVS